MAEQDKMSPTRLLASQTKLVYAALIKDQCAHAIGHSLYSAFSWRTLPINEPTKACQIRQKQLFSVGAAEIPRLAMDVMGGSTSGIIEAPTAPSKIPTQDNKTQQSTN